MNDAAKAFMKRKYTECCCGKISEALDSGKEVQLKLSILKPLHIQWVAKLYNYPTSEKGRDAIDSGWKAAGITNALSLDS